PAAAANTPPPPQSSAPAYSGATGPASGPIPRAPQTGQPWAPASGPVPAAGQPAAYYQGAGPNWGSPPPQQPWNQPPKPKRNPWPIIAAVAVVLVVAVAGVGIWLMIRPKPAPPPPDPIPADRLSALLLGPSDINSIMGSSTMEPGKPIQSMDTSSVTLSSPDCQGALYTSQDPVYAGSGYTGVSGLVSSEPGDNYDHWVNQAVVRFPSADKAKSFMQTAAGKWKGCAGKTVTVTNKGKTYRWTFAQINGSPPKMTVLDTQEGADGWECERAMSQANNVIVDVNACGYHITDQGGQITDKIVGKIATE
ncbi:sensor domain-containing protein, partial [Mycobacterium sp. IS-836]|uniref:sensor domain-containing protein n=1 Tax=Mycobacterium sp. IS-836 TaxID=1834160 RepID=UPI0011542A6D